MEGLAFSFYLTTILALTKLKAVVDDKFNVAKMMVSVSDEVENIVGKGKVDGYQQILFFPKFFLKALISKFLKFEILW